MKSSWVYEIFSNTDWRKAQFVYDYRLPGEMAGEIIDIHFVPEIQRMVMGAYLAFSN